MAVAPPPLVTTVSLLVLQHLGLREDEVDRVTAACVREKHQYDPWYTVSVCIGALLGHHNFSMVNDDTSPIVFAVLPSSEGVDHLHAPPLPCLYSLRPKNYHASSPIASYLPSNYSDDDDGGPIKDRDPPYDDSDPSYKPSIVLESPRYSYDEETEYEKEEEDNYDETYIEENSNKEDEEVATEVAEEEAMAAAYHLEWEAEKRKRAEAAAARVAEAALVEVVAEERGKKRAAKKRREEERAKKRREETAKKRAAKKRKEEEEGTRR
nr:protein MNN4-like [Setaria viridis]